MRISDWSSYVCSSDLAMCPLVGVHPTAGDFLDVVVADGVGRTHGLLDVAVVEFEDLLAVVVLERFDMMGPQPGIAVGLELQLHSTEERRAGKEGVSS